MNVWTLLESLLLESLLVSLSGTLSLSVILLESNRIMKGMITIFMNVIKLWGGGTKGSGVGLTRHPTGEISNGSSQQVGLVDIASEGWTGRWKLDVRWPVLDLTSKSSQCKCKSRHIVVSNGWLTNPNSMLPILSAKFLVRNFSFFVRIFCAKSWLHFIFHLLLLYSRVGSVVGPFNPPR